MASPQSLIGLLGVSLLLARIAAALAPERMRFRVAAGVIAVCWLPLGGIPLAGYVRGVTGDLSATTLVWSAVGIAGGMKASERRAGAVLVAVAALVLYPSALGWSAFDVYRLGYRPGALLWVLFIAAALAWSRRCYVVLACVLAAVLGHRFELLESSNLWDYVIDPWVALAAIYDLRTLRRKA